VEGICAAKQRSQALTDLESQGLVVYELRDATEKKEEKWFERDIQLFGSKISNAELSELCWFLYSTLEAGHSLDASIDISAQVHSSHKIRKILGHVQRSLRNGISPADAFKTISSFPREFVIFVQGGAASNELPSSFHAASKYFQQQSDTQNRIIGAIAYPVFLILAGFCVFSMILFYLTPTLYQTITASGQEVQGVLNFLERFRNWIVTTMPFSVMLIVVVLFGSLLLLWCAYKLLLEYVPRLKRSINTREYARLSRVLSSLLISGVPLTEALNICIPLASKDQSILLRDAVSNISIGERTCTVFESENRVPFGFSRLYAFGEQANELSSSLGLAAEILERQYTAFTTKLVSIIAPTMTVFVGGCIGFLVYVVISAVLQVSSLATP